MLQQHAGRLLSGLVHHRHFEPRRSSASTFAAIAGHVHLGGPPGLSRLSPAPTKPIELTTMPVAAARSEAIPCGGFAVLLDLSSPTGKRDNEIMQFRWGIPARRSSPIIISNNAEQAGATPRSNNLAAFSRPTHQLCRHRVTSLVDGSSPRSSGVAGICPRGRPRSISSPQRDLRCSATCARSARR